MSAKLTRRDVAKLIDRITPWIDKAHHQHFVTDLSRPIPLRRELLSDPVPPEYLDDFKRLVHLFPGELPCLETLIKNPHDLCLHEFEEGTLTLLVMKELRQAMEMLGD